MSADVAAAFYEDVQRRFTGQVIIIENTDPPGALDKQTVDVVFTKNAETGRYGFFPNSRGDITPSAVNA